MDFSDEDESWHKEGGVPRLIVIVPDLWIRKGETNRGLQNLDKEGGGKVYGQFDLIDLSRYAWFELGKRIFLNQISYFL